jgi:hypothetical protein
MAFWKSGLVEALSAAGGAEAAVVVALGLEAGAGSSAWAGAVPIPRESAQASARVQVLMFTGKVQLLERRGRSAR